MRISPETDPGFPNFSKSQVYLLAALCVPPTVISVILFFPHSACHASFV